MGVGGILIFKGNAAWMERKTKLIPVLEWKIYSFIFQFPMLSTDGDILTPPGMFFFTCFLYFPYL